VTSGVVVHRDAELLAAAAAARLVTGLVDAISARGVAHLVLTGGGVGIATLSALADSAARDAIDWRHLHLWWGDERFLPTGHPDRNETQARRALLDQVPLDPTRVHSMPADGGPFGSDVDAAAAAYADQLAAACGPEDRDGVPPFDILLLGMGPDGHVASLFPERPELYETERRVIAVRGAPKPPPTRISLTVPAIQAAQSVWLLAAGAEKAAAVAMALQPAGLMTVPASAAHGRRSTVWLLDRAAAAELPRGLARPASP
jgi:6-phosphogluconolactonase